MSHRALTTSLLAILLAACIGGACALTESGSTASISPPTDQAFSSTRQVNDLQLAPDGTLWAATSGGVRRRSPGGAWDKWTRQDGLPSHEARRVLLGGGAVRVQFPTHEATFSSGKWQVQSRPSRLGASSTCRWKGALWAASVRGLTRQAPGRKPESIALPPSPGTHISALLPRPDALWAAFFGDGLWRFDGARWARASIAVPAQAREITALAAPPGEGALGLWVGTRRDGIWRCADARGKEWERIAQDDEPFDTNVQSLASFGGALWLSTLEDGLAVRTESGWKHYAAPEISSNAPRQMATLGGALYVRHGGGQVDRFDGRAWRKDVFPSLPRGKVLALCAGEDRLFLGQWGGWSEWQEGALTHHLRFPELQGIPPMALHAQGEALWIGTQNRGLIEAAPSAQAAPGERYALRVWDERHGLPDDWIVSLGSTPSGLVAGTFVGGLATEEGNPPTGQKWRASSELSGQNVTALASDGASLWIATRHGLWLRDGAGRTIPCQEKLPNLDSELQALLATPQGLWVGARTGLFFVAHSTLQVLAAPQSTNAN